MRDEVLFPLLGFVLLVVLLVGLGAFTVFAAKQEAATFNRFRRVDLPQATTWDALFAELRIEACQ